MKDETCRDHRRGRKGRGKDPEGAGLARFWQRPVDLIVLFAPLLR